MTITFSIVWVPILLTIIMAIMMIRPYSNHGYFDLTPIFRAIWIIPILVVWLIYFAIKEHVADSKLRNLEQKIHETTGQ